MNKINIKAQKLMIVGINGSGKSNAGFYIASKQFKRFILVTPHEEDIRDAPKNAICVLVKELSPQELNIIMDSVKLLAEERKIDGVLLDDIDAFLTGENDLAKCPSLKIALINHRHYGKKNKEDKFGLGMIFMSRRPQNVPSALFEICEHGFYFSSPTSDNIKRKFSAIDYRLYEMVNNLKYKSFKFVYKELGKPPIVCKPLPLFTKKLNNRRIKKNDKTRSKRTTPNNENKSRRKK